MLTAATQVHAVSAQFSADCQALTRAPHRLTGSPEYAAAAEYVAGRFTAIGVDKVIQQRFQVMEPTLKRCDLTVQGRKLRLLPMRPDGIIMPVTPATGITGQFLHAGAGTLTDYGARTVKGKIVVLDYNAGEAWLRAFRLGACAVIFVANGPSYSWPQHYTEANANFPRYYYPGASIDLREGQTATIQCEAVWQPATGQNVIAFVKGSKPSFTLEQPETTVITANLDSYGEVPNLSPGARNAANCAALLSLAQNLVRNRPQRNIVLACLGGQAQGFYGTTAFYRALENDNPQVQLDNRLKYLGYETTAISKMMAALDGNLETAESSIQREVTNRLASKAAEHVFSINARMEDLNTSKADKRNKDDLAKQARLDAQLKAFQTEKDSWNDLRRAFANNDLKAAKAGTVGKRFSMVTDEVRTDIKLRSSELANVNSEVQSSKQLKDLLGSTFINLHISLLLGDNSPRWGMIIGGDSSFHSVNDQPGLYGKIQGTFAAAAKGVTIPNFEIATVNGSLDTRLFWPTALITGGDIAGRLGVYNVAIGTIQEKLPREGTPDDTLAKLNTTRLETQTNEFAALLSPAMQSDGLSLRRAIVPDKLYNFPETSSDGRIKGVNVVGTTQGSSMPNRPTGGAIVQLSTRPLSNFSYKANKPVAFDDFQVVNTDANAVYAFGPFPTDPYSVNTRGFAATFDTRGEIKEVSDLASSKTPLTRLNIFRCAVETYTDGISNISERVGAAVLPPQVEHADTQVMQSNSDAILDPTWTYSATLDGVVYWYTSKRVNGIKLFGLQSLVSLYPDGNNIKMDHDHPGGFSLLTPWTFPTSALRSASDIWRLNEERLNLLRSKGVVNSALEELHGRAQDLIESANGAKSIAETEAQATSAYMAERPVYTMVRQSLDDLVRAVLLLLALAIPFAFALERLLIGSTNIYKQIGWFSAFFTVTFGILFLVHPAFKISSQPIIIFLAFALVVLSSLVIVVIMQKFETELKVLQGLTSTVHSADVSRFSTMMAAVGMGISTMRRRPLRTALTALTITLLTFTILNFASFDTRIDVVRLPAGASPKYSGVLLHKVNWTVLNPELLAMISSRWAKNAVITSRCWLPADITSVDGPLLTLADGTNPKSLRGVLGLDPQEIVYRPDLRRILGTDGQSLTNGVFMTQALAKSLGVSVGQPVILGGVPLHVAGLLDASSVTGAKDMDDTGILPVDFKAMSSSQNGQPAQQQQMAAGADVLAAAQNKQDWVVLPTDTCVIVSNDVARLLGATLRVVTMYTPDAAIASAIAEDASRILPLPVVGTRPDGVFTHVLAPTVMAKGLKDLIFPIILGGLVIFGTMLGSVADREKEIYTFSALGLAPAHVATLFFAEALVYSFIGGMGGYLLAQGIQKLLTFLVNIGALGSMPEMNYSSTNAIVTILIVMGTVLVSAIYPAYKASHSANPGVLRSWRVPAPDGDVFNIVFPFTVSQYDITGVMSFLKEHFDNFTDTSLGVFMARDTHIEKRDGDSLGLKSLLALAPFDLGVTQDFTLHSVASEIPGIDEVKIEIVRRSGQHKDWSRLNKVLLDDLRRQFLIWRALPQETMEHYRNSTLTTLGAEMPESTPNAVSPTAQIPVA